jgi:hypothetical protein
MLGRRLCQGQAEQARKRDCEESLAVGGFHEVSFLEMISGSIRAGTIPARWRALHQLRMDE